MNNNTLTSDKDLESHLDKLYSGLKQKFTEYNTVSYNDLPKHTPWVKRILGLEPVTKRIKSKEEIIREFEIETYKDLYEKFNSKKWDSFFDYREFIRKEENSHPKFFDDSYYLMPEETYTTIHSEFISRLAGYFLPAENIIELGAGYGGVLLDIASRKEFSNCKCTGTDISKSAVKLLSEIAERFQLNAAGIEHDFNDCESLNFISHGDIVYTNHSLMYVPEIKRSFFEAIIACGPKAVINIEPLYPENNALTIKELMIERYISINGYNRNLSGIIKELNEDGRIELLYSSKPILGHHPFLPVSIIIWKPVE